jgi:DNA-binding XRE family transcriptional regulator
MSGFCCAPKMTILRAHWLLTVAQPTWRAKRFTYYSQGKNWKRSSTVAELELSDHPDLKPVVGRVLARFRGQAGITQEKLAEAAGLDAGYISLIERGHRMPTVDTIFRLCRGLKVLPSDLIGEVEKQDTDLR